MNFLIMTLFCPINKHDCLIKMRGESRVEIKMKGEDL